MRAARCEGASRTRRVAVSSSTDRPAARQVAPRLEERKRQGMPSTTVPVLERLRMDAEDLLARGEVWQPQLELDLYAIRRQLGGIEEAIRSSSWTCTLGGARAQRVAIR